MKDFVNSATSGTNSCNTFFQNVCQNDSHTHLPAGEMCDLPSQLFFIRRENAERKYNVDRVRELRSVTTLT